MDEMLIRETAASDARWLANVLARGARIVPFGSINPDGTMNDIEPTPRFMLLCEAHDKLLEAAKFSAST